MTDSHIPLKRAAREVPERRVRQIKVPNGTVMPAVTQPPPRSSGWALAFKALVFLLLAFLVYGVVLSMRNQRKRPQPLPEDALPPRSHVGVEEIAPVSAPASEPVDVPLAESVKPVAAATTIESADTVQWSDADFKRGARAFNHALDVFERFKENPERRDWLREIEAACNAAVAAFQACRDRAPAGVDIEVYIRQCYHLHSSARQRSLLNAP